MRVSLRVTSDQHRLLKSHLHPGDGREAAAWLLCGRRSDAERSILCGRQVFPIAYDATVRTAHSVTWRADSLGPVLDVARRLEAPAIVHVHSHPEGANAFSTVDDECDRVLHADLAKIYEDGEPTGSLIMLPNGDLIGRGYHAGQFEPLDGIFAVGDLIQRFPAADGNTAAADANDRRQVFGDGTTSLLGKLRIAVVGCSGTGSVVIELLARLGVGELILIDPDVVESKNLNRIINSMQAHAELATPKVNALSVSIARNLGSNAPRVIPVRGMLMDAWRVAATADVVFGCTDSAEARLHLDRLCHQYVMPYIDVGVDLRADSEGGVDYAGMAVHYLKPGGDSLFARHGYRMETVTAEALRRTDPAAYADRVRARYIRGVEEDRPAVISINTQAASMAVNELLARLHGYRSGDPKEHACRRVTIIEEIQVSESCGPPCPIMSPRCGLGDTTLPLGLVGSS